MQHQESTESRKEGDGAAARHLWQAGSTRPSVKLWKGSSEGDSGRGKNQRGREGGKEGGREGGREGRGQEPCTCLVAAYNGRIEA